MVEQFNDEAERAMQHARRIAKNSDKGCVLSDYLLSGLLEDRANGACRILRTLSLNFDEVTLGAIQPSESPLTPAEEAEIVDTPRVIQIMKLAKKAAKHFQKDSVGTEHILLAIMQDLENQSNAALILSRNGITADIVMSEISNLDKQ
ncbi:MAG: Clp protease N-terminal domain-containing protein [Patescibacteria group bacterium]